MTGGFLLVTDLDHTLVGDDVALARLNEILQKHRQDFGTKIVYNTGRSYQLYQQLAPQWNLLEPDALIVAVGTEIYYPGRVLDGFWPHHLAHNWHRDQICQIADQFPELISQPASEQNSFKISFFLKADAAPSVVSQLKSQFILQNLEAKIIYSSDQDLDILPQRADKGQAMQFLRKQWSISPQNTVVCGDSGNDIGLFSVGKERGIIVGNARPELRQWYEKNGKTYHYCAEKYYAAGILEGLQYFRFLVKL